MNQKTIEEIESQIKWDEDGTIGEVLVSHPVFNEEVSLRFYLDWRNGQSLNLTDKMKEGIKGFLALSAEDLEKIKDLLWADCQSAFKTGSYSNTTETKEKSLLQINMEEFEISSKDEAFSKSPLAQVEYNHESEKFKDRYYLINFDTPWAPGYGTNIIMQNDKPIDMYGTQPYFGEWDEGGKFFGEENRLYRNLPSG